MTTKPAYPPFICLQCLRRFTYPLLDASSGNNVCPYCHSCNFAETDSVFPGGPCCQSEKAPIQHELPMTSTPTPKQTGHPLFEEITADELRLHREKNADYAGGGRPLGNFERVAAILALYPGLRLDNPVVVAVVYMMKQLDCVLWMLATDREGKVEDVDTRLRDVHVYAKLSRILYREWKERRQQAT